MRKLHDRTTKMMDAQQRVSAAPAAPVCDCGQLSQIALGKYGYVYTCPGCGNYVGCHPGTKVPLGTLANKELRELRIACHSLFESIFANRRKEGYKWLSTIMWVPMSEAHIGMLNKEQCNMLIDKLRALAPPTMTVELPGD